jgi:hypothetical protein
LERSEMEGAADGGVHFLGGASGDLGDEAVELGAEAKDAEDELGDEAGVAGVEAAGAFGEQVGCEAAALHGADNLEGNPARRGHPPIIVTWNSRKSF